MGKFTVRLLWQGQDIFQQHYNPRFDHAYDLAAHYGIQRMNGLDYEGEDATLDFEIEQLGETIAWDTCPYPTPKLRLAIMAIIALVPVRKALEKVIEKIEHCRFEQRYDLDNLGREALRIIDNATPSAEAPYWAFARAEAGKAIEHTLGKEVELAIETKYNASKRSQNAAMSEARGYLIRDIKSFLHSASLLDTGKLTGNA